MSREANGAKLWQFLVVDTGQQGQKSAGKSSQISLFRLFGHVTESKQDNSINLYVESVAVVQAWTKDFLLNYHPGPRDGVVVRRRHLQRKRKHDSCEGSEGSEGQLKVHV